MMSLYTTTILTTIAIAGMLTVMVDASAMPSPQVMESSTLEAAHEFAIHRQPVEMVGTTVSGDVTRQISMGPYYITGRARSLFVQDVSSSPTGSTTDRFVVTWLVTGNENDAHRIAGRYHTPEGTRIGVWGSDGAMIGGMPVPEMSEEIPRGAVTVITRIGGSA